MDLKHGYLGTLSTILISNTIALQILPTLLCTFVGRTLLPGRDSGPSKTQKGFFQACERPVKTLSRDYCGSLGQYKFLGCNRNLK